MLFSLRNDLLDDDAKLNRVRNRTWNSFSNIIDVYHSSATTLPDVDFYDVEYTLLCDIGDKFGLSVTNMYAFDIYNKLYREIKAISQINSIYDFIEAVLEALFSHSTLSFGVQSLHLKKVQDFAVEKYSQLLKDENLPYQVYNNYIVPLISDAELQEVEKAATTCYDSVNTHIQKAWLHFSNRKSPDYENSIKESISAVESICRIITGVKGSKTTLGDAIKQLKGKGVHIHPAMEKAFLSLYGYTSDENGIRHGGIDFTNAPAEDAKYMLISCSAFVNYLMEKWSKINH